MIARLLVAAFLVCAVTADARAADTYLLLITGVSGDEGLAADYQKWGASIVDGAKKHGVPAGNILYLAEATEKDPARIRARSTKEGVAQAITDLAAKAKPEDEIFIILIGHGTFDRNIASFNLPGPDLTADDFATLLKKFPPLQRIVFVNTTASSGAFIEPLKGLARTLVTATKTGGERLDTKFPAFFVEALDAETADVDKNGRISISEAFEYAKSKVVAVYEQGGHIITEHATIEDGNQGKLAATMYLSPQRTRDAATTAAAAADPALAALLNEQDVLERQVAELRLKKEQMDSAQYDQQLEKLLTDLALKTRQIRDRQSQK